MAEAATLADSYRNQVVLSIDDDFLRFTSVDSQVEQDSILAQSLMAEQTRRVLEVPSPDFKQLIQIKIDRADLVKNYGFTKMDPYCKITIGSTVLETPTCYGASTKPVWNKVLRCPFMPNVNRFTVEIMDENQFYADSRVAYCTVSLSGEMVNSAEPHTLTLPLSGQQGEGKEGVLYFQVQVHNVEALASRIIADAGFVDPERSISPHLDDNPIPEQVESAELVVPNENSITNEPYVPSKEEINQLLEMFPTVEEAVIKSILEANEGNLMESINSMLTISVDESQSAAPAA